MGDNNKNDFQSNLLSNEKGGIEALLDTLKYTIFNVLFLLLKDEEDDSIIELYVSVGLDYVQMLGFPMNNNFFFVWKGEQMMNVVFRILMMFNLVTIFPITYQYYVVGAYMLCFCILLIMIDIGYVSYQITKNKINQTWPIAILRSVASIFVTVLFLPITETLISIISCTTTDDGKLVVYYFNEIECYIGWHLVHSIICTAFQLMFISFSIIVAIAYFEPRMCTGNRTARQDNSGELCFITNKVVFQFIFAFVTNGFELELTLLLISLGMWLWYIYNFHEPYYDKEVQRFYNLMSTIYLWTTMMLLVSYVFVDTDFEGGLIAWGLGIPFIASIMISAKRSRINRLLKSQVKFRSGDEVLDTIRYVLQLIDEQKTDKNSYMLLCGYVEKHKELCEDEDCPLKPKKQKRKKQSDINMEEITQNLLKELDRMYRKGLKKFPNSTQLRLSYVFFLMERMKNKRDKALEQLERSEMTKPNFGEQFIIYRFKKIIKENLDVETEDEGEDKIVQIMAFESHIKSMEETMMISARLQKEFWAELKEEQPDLIKLNVIGSQITKMVPLARFHFKETQVTNDKFSAIQFAYASFLNNVLNEKEEATKLLEKAHQNSLELRKQYDQKKDELEFQNLPIAYATVSNIKKQNLGKITNVNLLFSVMFGYQKEELINKPVDVIVPQLFHDFHSQQIIKFQERINAGIYDEYYIGQQQSRFGKDSNGYIFPLVYKVSLTEDYSNFIASFQIDTKKQKMVFFYTNQDGVVSDITATAIRYFDLDAAVIRKGNLQIEQLIPRCLQDKQYSTPTGKDFSFLIKYPNGQEIIQHFNCKVEKFNFSSDTEDDEYDEDDMIKSDRVGFLIAVEQIDKKQNSSEHNPTSAGGQSQYNMTTKSHKNQSANVQKTTSENSNNTFFPSKPLITDMMPGQRTPQNNKNIDISSCSGGGGVNISQNALLPKDGNKLDQFGIGNQLNVSYMNNMSLSPINNDNDMFNANFFKSRKQSIMKSPIKELVFTLYKGDKDDDSQECSEQFDNNSIDKKDFIDYAQDIIIRRLINNKIESLWEYEDEKKKGEEDDDEELENSIFKNQFNINLQDKDDYAIFQGKQSTQLIRDALNFSHQNQYIKKFQILSFFWIVLVIFLTLLLLYQSQNKILNLELNIDVVEKVNQRLSMYSKVVSRVIDLTVLNKTLYPQELVNSTEYKQQLIDTAIKIIELSKQLNEDKYSKYLNSYSTNEFNIEMYSYGTEGRETQSLTYENAVIQLNTMAITLAGNASIQSTDVAMDNPYFNTIIHNYYKSLYKSSKEFSQNIINITTDDLYDSEATLLVVMSISITVSLSISFLFIYLMIEIKKNRDQILFLYLDIPQKNVFMMHRRCDHFIKNYVAVKELIRREENNEQESSDEGENEQDEERQYYKTVVTEGNEEDSNDFLKQNLNRKKIIRKFNANKFKDTYTTIFSYIIIGFIGCIFCLIAIITIFQTKSNILQFWDQYCQSSLLASQIGNYLNIQKIMLLDQNYLIENQQAYQVAFSQLKELINRREHLQKFITQLLEDGQDMKTQYMNIFFGNICQIIQQPDCDSMIQGNQKLGLDNVIIHYFTIFQNNLNQFSLNTQIPSPILSKKEFIDIDKSIFNYVYEVMQYYVDFQQQYMISQLDNIANIQNTVAYIFLFVFIMFFLFYWLPYLNRLNVELNQTIQMLSMIPIKVIKENPNIRRFVKNLIKQMNVVLIRKKG